ncbi:MAG: ATP-binding protein [Flavipsychrobacter sp.]
MYKEVKLNEKFSEYFCKSQYEDQKNIIDSLSRINIFIGANNSGKSRMLRRLFYDKNYRYAHKDINAKARHIHIKRFLNNLKDGGLRNYTAEYLNDVIEHLQEIFDKLTYWDIHNANSYDEAYRNFANAIDTTNLSNSLSKINIRDRYATARFIHDRYTHNLKNTFSLLNEKLPEQSKFDRYYIPVLRSLKGLSPKQEVGINAFNDIYKTHTQKEYFKENDTLNIFTGLSLYEDTTKLLLGDTAKRNKIKEFEKFLEDSFFQKEVNIVPHLESKTLHIKIGNRERPIHELGDGVQSIIILTYQLFMQQGENAIFFFEEPETHLHPGYQRLFIETLLDSRFDSFQYFMTTHSNHFLDITLDYNSISAYTFNRRTNNDNFDVENVTSGDENVLKLIGARTSSVFLSNCTIWVEGITDRIYIRKYLEMVQKTKPIKYKEDYHFSFVEYAGNNITHWSFLDAEDPEHDNINVEHLCAKLFLVTDNDGAGLKLDGQPHVNKKAKYERHLKLQERLDDRYYLLQCREIENLLTKDVIKRVIEAKEPEDAELDFKKFDKKPHKVDAIGKFIEKNVTGLKRKYTYKSDTINDKLGFAKKAVEQINTYDDMSAEAKDLAERLYNFIKSQNS